MQFAFNLCFFVLASGASASHFRQDRQEPVQVPVPVTDLMTAQPQDQVAQVVPSTQVVTDAMQLPTSPETQPVATMQVTQPGTVLQDSQPLPPVMGAAQSVTGLPVVPMSGQTGPAPQIATVAPHLSQLAQQVVSQGEPRNVTKIAFGQITDLGTEFHQLREDDQAHVKQLGVDIHLREHLEQQLHAAEERLEHDNAELAQETGSIVTVPSADASPQNSTGDSAPSAALVQAQTMKVKTDQIALATARDVKTLDADISSLHARDANEVKALRGNAQTRSSLSTQIAKEREELMANSETLAANLGQIRDLVAPSNTAAAEASPAPADASSSVASPPSEALVQQDQPAMQESAPVAVATSAPEAATETAPEAASGSAWLR